MSTRYQIVNGKDGKTENFSSKVKASKRLKELKLNNEVPIDTEVWDCYNNGLSNMFRI